MNKFKHILFFLLSLSMVTFVSSCGLKGDLYHPPEPEKEQTTAEEKQPKADKNTEKKPQ